MSDKPDDPWRKKLTPEEYRITREHGTEPAFTGVYWNSKTPGRYVCTCCGAELFDSEQKYDSGTGWPSFWRPANEANIATKEDHAHNMHRTEVLCNQCDAHLGHVFNDGPSPTGERYCINSASLKLKPRDKKTG